ncbi:hypothetical protein ES288_D10G272800v1 [Gossypium darwinii]|uniref:Uncharacterized protein n=1 Tax=Gossypium darwinii TaxID=34276 RepID=A0A5D2B2M6_GOSDA|nr:hypothetical protein ES288_D10G272800v1 [Gossypium darwinii]
MDERMIEAAQTGDIDLLYELIQNDPYVFQRIDDVPFFHTPLHVAAAAGRVDFMMEMINLKPSFARKLNQAGFSPMHLALQDNRTQAVLQLLKFDKGLVRVKGREGFTPLHHVVQTGDDDLLIKFLKVCPEAIEDVTVRNETVFHLAVKSDMFETFQVLVGWLKRSHHESAQRWDKELLSWADIDGNSVLHIAAIRNRPRVVEVLLKHLHRYQINAKNLEGLTALDIQSQYPWNERQADRIIDMLSNAGGLSGSSSLLRNTSISSFRIKSLKEKMTFFEECKIIARRRGNKGIPHEMHNIFLVVTVLIITTTYEASLNLPKTPDDSPCPSLKYQVSLSQDQPLNSHTFLHKTDINTAPIPSPSAKEVSKDDYLTFETSLFWFYNTLTFWAAVFLTAFLLPRHLYSSLILLTLGLFGRSYMILFKVSSWSWEQCEFSDKQAHLFYVASVCNFLSLFAVVLLVVHRILSYVLRSGDITKPKLFILLLLSAVTWYVVFFGPLPA